MQLVKIFSKLESLLRFFLHILLSVWVYSYLNIYYFNIVLYLLNFGKMFYQDFFPQLCNIIIHVLLIFMLLPSFLPKRIEYILEGNLLEKSVKRPFWCTASILQVYFTYLCHITCWTLEYHFIENLKLLLKENQIMK